MTKELGLPWKEAAPILRQTYEQQIKWEVTRPREKVASSQLWKEYQGYRTDLKLRLVGLRAETLAAKSVIVSAQKVERTAFNAGQKKVRDRLFAKHRGDPKKLKMEKMLLAKVQADEKAALRDQHRAALAEHALPKVPNYIDWLTEQEVTAEQERALAKAKEMKARKDAEREAEEKEKGSQFTITGVVRGKKSIVDIRSFDARMRHDSITYHSKAGHLAFTDIGNKIEVSLQRDPDAVLAALQLAAQKYGKLTLTGDAEFQQLCVELAARHGFSFQDEKLSSQVEQIRESWKKPVKFKGKSAPQPTHPAQPEQAERAAAPEAELPTPAMPMPLLPCAAWVASQAKPQGDPKSQRTSASLVVEYISHDGIVLSHGREVAIYPLPPGFDIKVGQKVGIDKSGQLFFGAPKQQAKEL